MLFIFFNSVRNFNCRDWCLSRQIQWGHPIPAYYHKDFPAEWVSATDLEVSFYSYSDKSVILSYGTSNNILSTQTAKKKLQDRLGIQLKSDSDVCQDSDVLDTWFSSALIPLSTSGWPDADVSVNKCWFLESAVS
jgi:valyl-tRNA synthetase